MHTVNHGGRVRGYRMSTPEYVGNVCFSLGYFLPISCLFLKAMFGRRDSIKIVCKDRQRYK